ncbi:ABC transporter ATP-binding protein [Rhizobium sp. NXC24]|uniref:ABC transporter ATP-binding protein n=1 Tax=Rhizobium sp. NXC24 TaxID=2048897 RepID=UPI000CDF4730|nr:ABC transporter ATP-binding protein [Rhizobium sp. NXC24]AVA25737.1 polysaccharide ABC transporter Wzt-like ATP-binding protein [Rhizobium sp. NXC24]
MTSTISLSGVGKYYKSYKSRTHRILHWITGNDRYVQKKWILSDVSFDVKSGETVAIVGKNGAGKSTLLKMITGTLSPSTGDILVKGRVAALLELGTGFHPDFTGRQNVIMAGQLLGLSVAQMLEKIPLIEAFAEIGDYFDQPVRIYSSGMYVRLAFALIANVDADVLIIDEALAVGDAIFIQKCMRFIRRFQETGTILFVSHDMGAVQNLCSRAVWLDQGGIRKLDTARAVAEEYLRFTLQHVYGSGITLENNALPEVVDSAGEHEESTLLETSLPDYRGIVQVRDNLQKANGWRTGAAELLSVSIRNKAKPEVRHFEGGERVVITIRASAQEDIDNPIIGFLWRDRLGQDLFGENTLPFTDATPMRVPAGSTFKAEFEFTLPMLPNGQYSVEAAIADGTLHSAIQHHFLHDALIVNVASTKVRWGLIGIPFNRINLGFDQ